MRFILGLLIVIVFISCSKSRRLPQISSIPYSPLKPTVPRVKVPSWILWREGRDVSGSITSDPKILAGDRDFFSGAFARALRNYQSSTLQDDIVIQRIAGTFLVVNDPKRALGTISDFYKKLGGGIARVPEYSSLLLGIAYSRGSDKEQGVAWLLDAKDKARVGSLVYLEAETALEDLLSSIPASELDSFIAPWRDDPRIESVLRGIATKSQQSSVFIPPPNTRFTVGVLLPLTGNLSQLGLSSSQGMQLVFDDLSYNQFLYPAIRDSGVDPGYTEQAIDEMLRFGPIDIFIGPLASDHANFAANAAKARQIPIITMAKSSNFVPGGGVFRFGTTSESQIEALIEVVRDFNPKIAVVYPNTELGNEMATLFVDRAAKAGLRIGFTHSFERGDANSLGQAINRVVKEEIEAVFFPDIVRSAANFFMALPDKVKSKVIPLGIATWDSLVELQNSSFAMNKAVFPTFYSRYSNQPGAEDFYQRYVGRYNQEPDLLAAQGYDIVKLVGDAARLSFEMRIPITEALLRMGDFRGITGIIRVSTSGEIIRKLPVLQFEDNVLKPFTGVKREIITE